MLRDVFYYGLKPNVHPREQFAENLEDARQKCTTEHFWIINEFCDYRNFDWDFDFEFLPDEDVWAEDHNNVWPSQWQKDSGTWLCPKKFSDITIYRGDVDPVRRKNIKTNNWTELDLVDSSKFDFSWHPDPTDPPYIYKWGCKFFPAQFKHVLEYKVHGATATKYMSNTVELLPEWDKWQIPDNIDKNSFDFTWRPDPMDPPMIYEFGTQWQRNGGPIYTMDKADAVKYTNAQTASALPSRENWEILEAIDESSFDFSWHPDNTAPALIYAWGNQWNKAVDKVSVQYVVPGATNYQYMDGNAVRTPDKSNWFIPENIDDTGFDYSWEPSPASPPYIYEFATQWQKTGGPQYVVEGATEKTYVDFQKVTRLPSNENWTIPGNIDPDGFDFSWHPDATTPPYVYVFATQWAFSGGPVYTVPGATEISYIDTIVATAKVDMANWEYNEEEIFVESFDFSWHPYVEDQPYIYQFGTQWQKTGGPRYITPGADSDSPIKYIDTRITKAKRRPVKDNRWVTLNDYKIESFDYSWHPDDTEEPYIYVFGNNFYPAEEMPTIEYRVPGATETKYVHDTFATLGQDRRNWKSYVPVDESKFDFSWKPNPLDPPYIYRWGNPYVSNKYKPTIEYIVPGATDVKYMTDDVAVLPEWDRWEIPDNLDTEGFDFTWRPDPLDPDFIWQFGTQWQKTGGPRYVVPGATQTSYVDFQKAKRLPTMENWTIPENIDPQGFDFSWHPDDTHPAYKYIFATQWAFSGGPIYTVPGATEISYVDDVIATAKIDMTNWVYNEDEIDVASFDWSWHPYVEDQPYIYEFGTQHQKTGGPRYITPGSDSSTPIKYIDTRILKATRLPNKDVPNWEVLYDIEDFDYSWHPDSTEEPYNYVFGNQWYSAEVMPTVVYNMPGAKAIKYVHSTVAKLAPNMDNWVVPKNLDTSKFDFSWRPEPGSPSYIYQFGTQWQKTGGPSYVMHGATEKNYVDFQKAIMLPSRDNWSVPGNIDPAGFDFSWHPDDTFPPYKYIFATQWAFSGGPVYTVPGATEISYVDNVTAKAKADMTNWVYNADEIDVNSFDWSWHPYVEDQPYIYQFGTQWQKTGGPRYITPGSDSSTPIKYIDTRILKAKRLPNRSRFTVLGGAKVKDFDWSWHPDDSSPPYIYQFGNNWYPAEEMPTVEYKVEGATEAKFITDIVARLAPSMDNWTIPENVDATKFDFSWIPHPTATPYIYQFGTSADPLDGPIYTAPGNKGEIIKVPRVEVDIDEIIEDVPVIEEVVDVIEEGTTSTEQLDMFFVDKGNPESAARFEALKAKFGNKIQKTRYLNSWVDTINRCINRATSDLIWVLNSELDYSTFTFDYYPNLWQMKMVHVFGTQWSHWGTTFMVNRETFPEDTKYIKIIEHLSNLNFVKSIRATATACVHDIVMIDHGNKEVTKVIDQVEQTAGRKVFATISYEDSYLNTIRNYVKKLPDRKEHYLWICSSVCDYSAFDFTYVCDPFAKDNLHVFPSGTQKFGDTFFIDVNKTKEIIDEMEKLEDYHKVNFNGSVKTTRLPEPIIVTLDDTHVNAVHKVTDFPYATIITNDNVGIEATNVEPMNLWAPDTKNIIVTSTGATRIVVPAEAKDIVKRELYDYPYIKKMPKLVKSSPLDIVFLSNGETGAEENWEHLLNTTKGLPNRVVRVDGVNGRAAAYHAAAEASETPWMFTVFAKLKVSPKFDWNWQPDRMQVPKHYIFHAKNPVNGLTYGHQAMIAYNKKLTLANEGRGLDFTLDDEHETVPLISGTAMYNTDPFSTWRTAFREVLKLKADDSEESRVRLDAWLNKADGNFGQFSIKGALDAEEYYDEVDGEFDALKLSYEWDWLRKRFDEM